MKNSTLRLVERKIRTVAGSGIFRSMITVFLLSLFITISLSGPFTIQALAVTAEDIRDAVLGITTPVPNTMDLNADNKVDVADVIKKDKADAPIINAFVRVDEGVGTIKERVYFDSYYNGLLTVSISGTAVEGQHFNINSGKSIQVNGTSIDIPITIVDDEIISVTSDGKPTSKTIVLSLSADGTVSIAGGLTERNIYIVDNDALWRGSMEVAGTSLHFQMKIFQSANGIKGNLITDGHGIIPLNGTGTEWPATMALNGTAFHAEVDGIAIPDSLTLANVDFVRKLVFDADSQQAGQAVQLDSTIRGPVTESIRSETNPYMNRVNVGTFALLKDIPYVEPVRPQFTPYP